MAVLELPEAVVLAEQVNATLAGKRIETAVANRSPHRFAWYTGDPASYNARLAGKTVGRAAAVGGYVEIEVDDALLVTSTSLRYHAAGENVPVKHQLLLEFADRSALTAHVQMWGALLCFREGEPSGVKDYDLAKTKPSPLSEAFDEAYFAGLLDEGARKRSAKGFLATDQRVPGLGNGVLQDILWTAGIYPKRKMADLSDPEWRGLYAAVKRVLAEMTEQGGRDTERDLYDRAGGYRTILSAKTAAEPCPACRGQIKKEAYLGGSVYYCPACQR